MQKDLKEIEKNKHPYEKHKQLYEEFIKNIIDWETFDEPGYEISIKVNFEDNI